MKKRSIGLISFILSFSLLLTACSKSSSKKKNKDDDSELNEEIVEVFEGYEKTIKKMSFNKVSKYAITSGFEDLELGSDESDIVSELLKKVSIEVTSTKINEKKGTCSAGVKVTYVDLEAILGGYDGQIEKKNLIETIRNEKAIKKTVKVSLEQEDDDWIITDDAAIFVLLLNGSDDLSYYLSPAETKAPTTETTEEPTTTSISIETTPTPAIPTTVPDNSDETLNTEPSTEIVDRHVKTGDDWENLLKHAGFVPDEKETGYGITSQLYVHDPDDFAIILMEFDDASFTSLYADEMIHKVVYENLKMQNGQVSDSWQGNTHNIYSVDCTADHHNYDLYIYRDDTLLIFAAIEEYPNADVSIDYYILLSDLGIWDIPIDT